MIYISLLAVAVDPTIWGRVDGGDDQLIFKRQDFNGGIFSPGFGAVEATGDDRLKELAANLRKMVGSEITKIPPLAPIEIEATGRFDLPAHAFATSAPLEMPMSALPSWLAGTPGTDPSAATSPPAGGLEWMIGQLGQLPAVAVKFNVAVPRAILLLTGAVIALGMLASAINVAALLTASTFGVSSLTVGFVTCWVVYRFAPEAREKHRRMGQLAT